MVILDVNISSTAPLVTNNALSGYLPRARRDWALKQLHLLSSKSRVTVYKDWTRELSVLCLLSLHFSLWFVFFLFDSFDQFLFNWVDYHTSNFAAVLSRSAFGKRSSCSMSFPLAIWGCFLRKTNTRLGAWPGSGVFGHGLVESLQPLDGTWRGNLYVLNSNSTFSVC